ncbi:MAG: hypothetical protein IKB90_00430 [Alistipes sp.]|nr:hypothetical protein [Alistipes sp.]
MQNYLPKSFKIGDDEIIFVRGEGAKAEHTLAYVSISATEALVQKELIRTILP